MKITRTAQKINLNNIADISVDDEFKLQVRHELLGEFKK